jgi:hypothetical protein
MGSPFGVYDKNTSGNKSGEDDEMCATSLPEHCAAFLDRLADRMLRPSSWIALGSQLRGLPRSAQRSNPAGVAARISPCRLCSEKTARSMTGATEREAVKSVWSKRSQ